MATTPDQKVVAKALAELAEAVKHVISQGRELFLSDSSEAQLLYLASCQVIIRLQARLEDLPAEILARCTDLPLAEVCGMRNRMAHGYLDIDKSMLWETMSHEIIPLIENILRKIENYRKP